MNQSVLVHDSSMIQLLHMYYMSQHGAVIPVSPVFQIMQQLNYSNVASPFTVIQ